MKVQNTKYTINKTNHLSPPCNFTSMQEKETLDGLCDGLS